MTSFGLYTSVLQPDEDHWHAQSSEVKVKAETLTHDEMTFSIRHEVSI
jgi:hypothetical protein